MHSLRTMRFLPNSIFTVNYYFSRRWFEKHGRVLWLARVPNLIPGVFLGLIEKAGILHALRRYFPDQEIKPASFDKYFKKNSNTSTRTLRVLFSTKLAKTEDILNID